jgi:folate-dependent phosphoribosylglycinamide formyltransferase PurN
MLKIALLAPIHTSLYSRLVADTILKMEGVSLRAILVRNHLNWARFKSEFGRDGLRLLGKIRQKYIAGDKRYEGSPGRGLGSLAVETSLAYRSLKDLARHDDIPYMVVNDLNDPRAVHLLENEAPDLIAFTGGGLLRQDILSIPRIGVLNCHTGVLPHYRGMDVVEWTAAEGNVEKIGFGATLHLMDRGVDTGPILLVRKIEPLSHDSFKTIRARLEVSMVELMAEGIQKLRDNALQPQLQDAAAGRQYYVMHPRVKRCAEARLARQSGKETDH